MAAQPRASASRFGRPRAVSPPGGRPLVGKTRETIGGRDGVGKICPRTIKLRHILKSNFLPCGATKAQVGCPLEQMVDVGEQGVLRLNHLHRDLVRSIAVYLAYPPTPWSRPGALF